MSRHSIKDESDGTWTFTAKGLRAPHEGNMYDAAPLMFTLLKDIRDHLSEHGADPAHLRAVDNALAKAEGRDK